MMPNQTFNPYHHFGFLTNRISRLINYQMEQQLVDIGYNFPVSCIGILADLWQKDGITQKELGTSLIKTKSSITKMLSELVKEKLVFKLDDPRDKRNKLIFLTDNGKNLRKLVEKVDLETESNSLSSATNKEIATAKKVLQNIYLNLSTK